MNFQTCGAVLLAALSFLSPPLFCQIKATLPLQGEATTKVMILPADDAGLFVTVGIVGADASKVKVGEQEFKLVAQDPQSRITLLKSEAAGKAPTFGDSTSLHPGTALYRNRHKQGSVSRVISREASFHGQQLPLSFFRVHYTGSIPVPGQPLYDEDGELVAIAHQPSPDFGAGTYALPIEAIARSLTDYRANGSIRRCWLGLHLDHLAPLPAVVGLRPKSPAALAGLQKGDILVSLGEKKITTYASAVDAFYYLIPGQEIECKFLRGTKLITEKMSPKIHPSYAALESSKEKHDSE
jgi:S1-C subfamily serine protease